MTHAAKTGPGGTGDNLYLHPMVQGLIMCVPVFPDPFPVSRPEMKQCGFLRPLRLCFEKSRVF